MKTPGTKAETSKKFDQIEAGLAIKKHQRVGRWSGETQRFELHRLKGRLRSLIL